jgi:thioesterase domain-containing protein
VFFIHPVGGGVLSYFPIVRIIDDVFSSYGLQARHLNYDLRFPTSVEEIASNYLSLILKKQQGEVYNLIGWSFGGVIAYEIAQKLRGMNFKNINLILIDSLFGPDAARCNLDDFKHMLSYFIKDLLCDNIGYSNSVQSLPSSLEASYAFLIDAGFLSPSIHQDQFNRIFHLYHNNMHLNSTYVPNSLDIKVNTIYAQESAELYDRSVGKRFKAINSQINMIMVSGDHYSIMKIPRVNEIASNLKQILLRGNN